MLKFSSLLSSLLLLVPPAMVNAQASASPQTISIQSRALPKGFRSSSSPRRRALDPVNVPLDDFFLGTDLQWFGNITVGTPPQILSVVFDTGSVTLEVTSDLCERCPQKKFNTTASTTFVDRNVTQTISFDTGGGVDPVIDNDYTLTLRSAKDTIGLVGGFQAKDMDVFLIVNQTEKFDIDPYSGIQGLGASAQGLFEALINQGLPSLFSMYLTPKSVGNAELTLGGIDSSKFTGELIYGSLPPDPSGEPPRLWLLQSPGISVNGMTNDLLNTSRGIIFDSGTSNVVFSTNITEAIYSMISSDIKPNSAEPGTYGIACDKVNSLPATIDLTFTSQNGTAFNLTIPSSELNVGPFSGNSSECQTLINAMDGVEIVGGSLMKHYYTVYDIGKQRLGFAKAVNVSDTTPSAVTSGNGTSAGSAQGGEQGKPSGALSLRSSASTFALLMAVAFALVQM
ncbi:hypothetical protein D9613_001022 [Agrocybe pediades]|uniref:Peptidase A1 domain-containing protein n=1 Tax=Agrocybe pediades TaxID=84607 RepID=A0A8H4R1E6_9AGAR|nr:hypothetical protein D9613_001022 [Agrocybe pediades]